jgi:Anti-sigma-K factor rskA
MTAYTRDDLLQIAAAHATGSASEEEVAALLVALQRDPELADEVSRNVAAVEAMAMAQAVPPSDLVRGRLLAMARLNAPLPAAPREIAPGGWWTRRPILVAAAAAALIVISGLGAEVVRLRSELGRATVVATALRGQLDSRDAMLNPILTAENHLRVVHMLTADTVRGPGIQVYWNRERGTAVLHAFRLPPAPSGHRYQLWAMNGDAPRPIFAFDSEEGGHALVSGLSIPVDLRGIQALEVTVEPTGDAVAPSTPALLIASVTER